MNEQTEFTAKEFAELVDLSVRRIYQLASDGIITRQENGKYPASAISEYIEYITEIADRNKPSEYALLIQKEHLRALKRQNDQADQLVAPVEVLEHALSKAVTAAIPILESLPSIVKHHFPEVTDEQLALVSGEVGKCRAAFEDAEIRLDD